MHVIFDLDGTLADITHRLHFIADKKKADWDSFHRACVDDSPITGMIAVNRSLAATHTIEIWSGRSDMVCNETLLWLRENWIVYDTIKMRRAGDHTPDEKLKEAWLHSATRKPDLVFDDRKRVVDMWRRNGIRCCQVAPGEF